MLQQFMQMAGAHGGLALPRALGARRAADACAPGEALQALGDENRRLRAQAEARSRLFAAAVHDLRQPIQALMLHAQALAESPLAPVQLQNALQVCQSVESLDRLCASFLDLALLDAEGRPAPRTGIALHPVLETLRRSFDPVARQRGLRLVVRSSTLNARCDDIMLTRILNNLVSNALNNTVRGGVLVGARRDAGAVRIDVCDTGPGMAPGRDAAPAAARPAAEPGTQGSGLGLATVRRLAELQGGSVRIHSRPGRGTTVSVRLPASSLSGGAPESPR